MTIRPNRRTVLALAAAGFAGAGRAQDTGAPAALAPSPHAQPLRGDGRILHAIAMHGEPALPPDFRHLPYANPDAPKGGRLNLSFPGSFDSLNPYNLKSGSAAQGLSGAVYQTLLTRSFDEPFTLYGQIARTIETNAARDYVVYRLDPAARFSDGAPLTAADVLFTFNLLKEQGRPQHRGAYALVRKIEALDEHTIFYDLAGADDRELPLTLGFMPVLPRHRTDVARFADSSFEPPVASGPYRIVEVKPGESLLLRRNPDFWGANLPVARGLFNFDEIAITYFRDQSAQFEAFKTGLTDYREENSPTRWASAYNFPAVRDGRVVREQLPIGAPRGLEGFAFNLRRPLFQDIRVREALAMMFDFEWMNGALFAGLYQRTRSFFDNSELSSVGRAASIAERKLLAPFPGAVRPDVMEGTWRPYVSDGTGRDRVQARRALALLAEAGWRIAHAALEKDGVPFAFEIMTADRSQERLALAYANSLKRIGVSARVRTVDEVQYQRRRQTFDFDMMLGLWAASASPGNEQRMRWGEGSADQEASFNLSGARSPALDELIRAMLAATRREDFIDAVRAYDRVLLSGFYVVPLYHTTEQWDAYWTRIARPAILPKWAAPLFNSTLETWWAKQA
ncbi:MAG: ABC transporter substrate-binding protein [Hyphomicrobiales bacterium]|nr:ABC transporter substrate-binding protein [Hyphomicrobiales bacterium]